MPGYTVLLLQTIANPANKFDLRTAAATQFKAVIGARYKIGVKGKTSDKYAPIDESEKAVIRENILNSMVTDIVPVRNLLEDSLWRVVEVDFPENWPALPDMILGALQGQVDSAEQVLAALIALRAVIRRYDRSDAAQGDRASILSVADSTFPILKSLLEHLIANDSAQSQEVITLLLKVVWDASIYTLPNVWLQDMQNFDAWMQLMIQVFQQPVPVENIEHVSQLRKLPWFQSKKIVIHFWIRLSTRFLRSTAKKGTDPAEFAAFFSSTYPPLFLDNVLQALSLIAEGKMTWSEKAMGTLLDFLHTALSLAPLWQQLKPNVWNVIRGIFVPLLAFSEEDAYMFEYEADMYVARELDPLGNDEDPRAVALGFLYDLCKYREPIWLQELILYVSTELLRPYAALPGNWNVHQGDYAAEDPERFALACTKYAGLNIFGSLRHLIADEPEYFGAVEDIIVNHVLPDLHAAEPPVPAWLRAKGCWTFSRYAAVSFSDEAVTLGGLEGVLKAMLGAEEFPLVAEASTALFYLIPNPLARDILGPLVGELVDKYLSLMSRIDSDAIVQSLQYLMRHFPKLMRKSAVNIMSNLTHAFLKADTNSNEIDLGDDTMTDASFLAASSIIRAVHTLYRAIQKSPTVLYPALEPFLLPILDVCLSETGASYLEDILALCTDVSYYGQTPYSPELWQHMFVPLCKAYMKWAPDYMGGILPSLDNFLSRDPETFMAPGTPYLEMLCAFAEKYFVDPKYPELDMLPLIRLYEALLLEHPGRLDHIIEHLIRLTIGRITMPIQSPNQTPTSESLKTVLLEIILNCLYYDAALTLNILEANGWTADTLKMIFEFILNGAFTRVCDKKTASLGIGAMLRVPADQLPPYVREKMLEIVATWMQLTQQAEEQRIAELGEEAEEEYDYDSAEFSDDDGPMEGNDLDHDEFEFTDDEEGYGEALDDDEDDEFGDDEAQMAQALAMMKQQALEEGEDLDEDEYAALLGQGKEGEGHIHNRDDGEDLEDGYGPVGNVTEKLLDASLRTWSLDRQEFSEELPTNDINETIYLAETLEGMQPDAKQHILDNFTPEMHELYAHLTEVATDKAEKLAFEAQRKAEKAAERQELRDLYAKSQQQ